MEANLVKWNKRDRRHLVDIEGAMDCLKFICELADPDGGPPSSDHLRILVAAVEARHLLGEPLVAPKGRQPDVHNG